MTTPRPRERARARARAVVIGTLLALVLAACGSGAPTDPASADGTGTTVPEPTTKLVVGLTYVPDVQFAPFYVAQKLGYYAQAGLDVELRHHGANESLFAAIDQGHENVVVASGDEVMAQRATGGDLVQIATLYSSSPVALIAPADSGIAAPADLRGKTIGVPGEFGANYLGLLMLLAQGGLTTADVTIENIGYTQTTALLTHQVDAVVGYVNGDAVRLGEAGMDVVTLMPGDLVSVGIAAREASVTDDGDALAAFVGATLRGVEAVADDPARAVEITAEYVPGMTAQARADALAVLEATIPLLSTTGLTDAAQWRAMGEAMEDAGMVSRAGQGGFVNLAPTVHG